MKTRQAPCDGLGGPTGPDSAIPAIEDDRPSVLVLDAPAGAAALSATLYNLGYRVAEAGSLNSAEGASPDRIAMAIVSDALPRPLALASELARRVPVLLVSSDTSFENRLAAARAGVGGILSRPLDVSDLAEWLEQFTGSAREVPYSVLIIDDDEILAETYALALESAGMRASVVTNPASALDQMNPRSPDLVLMDVQMPGASGIEVAQVIRQSRRYLSLPIVFLSAERDPARQLAARKLGGDDFIPKPVDPGRLVSLVRMRAQRAVALRSMMDRDSLTGLLNHGRFKDRLAHELERCKRTGAEINFALIDVDRFKQVNDTYGHTSGDRVLRALSHTLTAGLRRTDVVGRYGGEEFGVILLDTQPHLSRSVLDRIRRSFADLRFESEGRSFSVSFSAGLASSTSFPSSEQLINAADQLLYSAKAGGRNRIAVAADDTSIESPRSRDLGNAAE